MIRVEIKTQISQEDQVSTFNLSAIPLTCLKNVVQMTQFVRRNKVMIIPRDADDGLDIKQSRDEVALKKIK